MNKQGLKRLYEECGICEYSLGSINDLDRIHGVKLNQVEGYTNLNKGYRDIVNFFRNFVFRSSSYATFSLSYENTINHSLR